MNKFIKGFSIAAIITMVVYLIAGCIGGYLYLNHLSGLHMSMSDLPPITYIAMLPAIFTLIYRSIVCIVCVGSLKTNFRGIPFEIISLVLIIVFSLFSTGLNILFGSIVASYGVDSLAAYSSFFSGFNLAGVISTASFICYLAVVFGSIIRKRVILKNVNMQAPISYAANVQMAPYSANVQSTVPYEQVNNVNTNNSQYTHN